jgi:hypothetical protein
MRSVACGYYIEDAISDQAGHCKCAATLKVLDGPTLYVGEVRRKSAGDDWRKSIGRDIEVRWSMHRRPQSGSLNSRYSTTTKRKVSTLLVQECSNHVKCPKCER